MGAGGAQVVTTVDGRSERTRALASGLSLLPTLRGVVAASAVVVSICPPGEAEACLLAIVRAAAETGATPLLADLNAISRDLVRTLSARVVAVGLASAVKMCTAAIYKGTSALWTQPLRAAAERGVLDEVMDDLRDA